MIQTVACYFPIPKSTISECFFVDGTEFTAENDGEGSEHEPDEVFAVYNADKQSLLIR